MESQNDILSDDILLKNAEPLTLSKDTEPLIVQTFPTDTYLDLSGAIAQAPLSQESAIQTDDDSHIKIFSDEKSPENDDSHIKILSDEKSLEKVETLNLSEGIESVIGENSSDQVILDFPGLVVQAPPSQETDIDFSILLGVAPPPQKPDSGNDTLTGDPSFLFGDDNPNNLSAAGSFVKTRIWGFGGNDTLTGGLDSDILDAGTGDDLLNGGIGDDLLNGGDGNDTLDGGYGYDTLDGGYGTDTANYSFWWGGIKANLQTEVVSFFNDWNGGTERLISIENVVGSTGNDEIVGGFANNVLSGGDGNDTLDGGYGYDTLDGGNGTDTANYSFWWGGIKANLQTGVVSFFNDWNEATERLISIENLVGSGGNDEIVGSFANNVLSGGYGNDTIVGGDGNDIVEGGDGNDVLYGGNSDNSYSAADGNDSLNGGSGNDVLFGGYGDDTLNGGSGSNNLIGGPGNDIAQVVDDTDMVFSGNEWGGSVAHGGNIDYLSNIEQVQLIGGDSNNRLSANQAGIAVKLEGRGGNDLLEGGRLDDTLEGGAGDDTLVGGMGTNHLYGGAGKDVFTLFNYDPGMQIVHDFERTSDRFDMQGVNLRDIRVTREGNDSIISVKSQAYVYDGRRYVIRETETPRFRVQNALVDSRDFTNVGGSGSFQHLPLSADARTNVGTLIREWATAYGAYIGKTFVDRPVTGGVDPLLSNLTFTQRDIKFSNVTPFSQPEFAATGSAIVRATAGGSVTFSSTFQAQNTTETTVSEEHRVGFSMARTISVQATPLGIGVGGDNTLTIGYDFTRSTATTEGKATAQDFSISNTHNLLPNSVTTVVGGVLQRHVDANFSADLAVDGNVTVSFADNSSVQVPIDAILQTYMPSVFQGQGAVTNTTLADGTYLVYNEDTVFTQAGTMNMVLNLETASRDYAVQDDDLMASSLGTHVGESHAERFWVARGSLPNRGGGTLELDNFHYANDGFMDKIGIEYSGISRFEQLTLLPKTIAVQTTGFNGIPETNYIPSTNVSLGARSLVDIVGVLPDQLNSSHFVFSTAGTFFDPSIRTANAGSTQSLQPLS